MIYTLYSLTIRITKVVFGYIHTWLTYARRNTHTSTPAPTPALLDYEVMQFYLQYAALKLHLYIAVILESHSFTLPAGRLALHSW
jgi:hypothetical protein